MANPWDPAEQLLSDWERRGGPGRLDRAAARRPRRFAAIYALVFTSAMGAGMTITAILVAEVWAWAVTAAVLIAGALGIFVAQHKSALWRSDVMRRWNDRAEAADAARRDETSS